MLSMVKLKNLPSLPSLTRRIGGNGTSQDQTRHFGFLRRDVPTILGPLNSQCQPAREIYGHCRIGNRDVVGYGINGCYNYKDDAHFPFPAIRFKENTQDIIALREKERGDWRMLCCEEKKALYRASFCQTFAEFQHPTGTWKLVLGWVFICLSFSLWVHILYHYTVWDEPKPQSLSPASQRAQLRRMIEARVNPIDGLTSQWDYDNDCWKWQKVPTREERKIGQSGADD